MSLVIWDLRAKLTQVTQSTKTLHSDNVSVRNVHVTNAVEEGDTSA